MSAKRPRRLGVYAGSFDPLTVGHLWMIEEGAKLFDHLIVAVGINPDKKSGARVRPGTPLLRVWFNSRMRPCQGRDDGATPFTRSISVPVV